MSMIQLRDLGSRLGLPPHDLARLGAAAAEPEDWLRPPAWKPCRLPQTQKKAPSFEEWGLRSQSVSTRTTHWNREAEAGAVALAPLVRFSDDFLKAVPWDGSPAPIPPLRGVRGASRCVDIKENIGQSVHVALTG